ncbi:MAG: MBL fold metallo-hydrolase [Desulfobacterales bacterium]|nr:MBL fold metallo-hydrolase [Desulfobacterales bacterium]
MPTITIHRGSRTIGGSCVEIKSQGHRLVLDLGSALMESGGAPLPREVETTPSVANGGLPDIPGIYRDSTPSVDALFISHAHLDHCGLLNHIHPDIPVHVSPGTLEQIRVGRIFHPGANQIHHGRFKTFHHWKSLEIGPFKVTSFLADHSGFDASSFLIETQGKRIFYSGDFRGHGRKAILLKKLVEKPIPNIDCLLMEGTTLGGEHTMGLNSENEVEEAFYQHFAQQEDMAFTMAAGSNVDRMVSLYRAARKADKTLVLDLYTIYLLEQLKTVSPNLPPFPGDHVRVFYIQGHAQTMVEKLGKPSLYPHMSRKIGLDEIVGNRRNMVLKLPLGAARRIARAAIAKQPMEGAALLYSMWQGYLERDPRFMAFSKEFNIPLTHIHVSGHARLRDLKALADALKPRVLIPIHTLCREDYPTHFNAVKLCEDGVPLEL